MDNVAERSCIRSCSVNVAARLEQACPPGGVLIAGAAYDQLPGKLDPHFEHAGELRLRNIARPVRAYRMVTDGAPASATFIPLADRPTVAVLPFENMSGDPDQVYFSDGITEDIITELSRFRELVVIARNSSFSFRGKGTDVRGIGRTPGAGYLVEGSVRRAGNRLRITAQPVEAGTGTHLWTERYDRAIEDVFDIQEEIARSIVATVAHRVPEDREAATRRRPPEDVRAYDLFLKGHRLSDVFTPGAQDQARSLFEQACTVDPIFARACTGLAYNHFNRAVDEGVGIPRERDTGLKEALELAEKALALDPNDPGSSPPSPARTWLGIISMRPSAISTWPGR
jgi:adenylate cyclase